MKDQRQKPVVVISLLTAACLIGDSMLYVVLPTHWKEVGLASLWEVGIILSANRLIRLPVNPIVGMLYRKISARNGVLFASVLAAITTASYGLVPGFLPLVAIRCLWGVAWTFLRLGAYFTILELSNDGNRGHYMGMYSGLYRLGSLAGMLVGGILGDVYGIGPTAIGFGVLTLFTIPFAFAYVPKTVPVTQAMCPEEESVWKTLRDKGIVWALVTAMTVALIYQGLFMATLSRLIHVHQQTTAFYWGIALGAATLGGVLQALRWAWEPVLAPWVGKLSDGKRGRRPILIAGLVSASVLFALVSLDMPVELWLAVVIGMMLTATVLTTMADAITSDAAAKSSKVTVMTAHSFMIDVGAAAGPMLAYILDEAYGTCFAYWAAAAMLMLLAVKWFFAPPRNNIGFRQAVY